MKPDVVIIATGATPLIPEIPGVNNRNVITASDLLLARKEVMEPIAVIGGGLVDCETSLYLAQKGKKVTVVEMLDAVADDLYLANRMYLIKLLSDANVKTIIGERALEIN